MSDQLHELGQPEAQEAREVRDVVMADPRLSQHTNRAMTEDLRAAVGASTVSVPVDRPHVESGATPSRSGDPKRGMTDSRLISLIFVAMFAGVAAVVAVGHGHGWTVPVAFVLVSGLALMVVRTVLTMTQVREHPSATTAAAMRADGIRDPDEFFSAAVAEFTATHDADTGEHRSTAVEDDPAQAAAEQQNAMTPAGGRSRAVGP